MNLRAVLLLAVGVSAVVAAEGSGVERHVPSPDYPTIQSAIDGCSDGDVVIIAPGTYGGVGNRDLDYSNGLPAGQTRAITVRGEDPDDPNVVAATVIDCEGAETDPHRGFYFHNFEGPNAVVAGLTITGGYAPASLGGDAGGGIYCLGDVTIVNCIVHGNTAASVGGGIYCFGAPEIRACTISENTARIRGGGIYCYESGSATITNCIISGNVAGDGSGGAEDGYGGGGVCCYRAAPTIINCQIAWNIADGGGGGVYSLMDSPTITNCTLVGNAAATGGGLYAMLPNIAVTLKNCILWDNTASTGHEIALVSSKVAVSYSDVQGGQAQVDADDPNWLTWGWGNVNADPRFRDADGPDGDPNTWEDNDYHISSGSPCINKGDPWGDYSGQTDMDGEPRVDGPRVDIGADEWRCGAGLAPMLPMMLGALGLLAMARYPATRVLVM